MLIAALYHSIHPQLSGGFYGKTTSYTHMRAQDFYCTPYFTCTLTLKLNFLPIAGPTIFSQLLVSSISITSVNGHTYFACELRGPASQDAWGMCVVCVRVCVTTKKKL